MTVAEAAAVAAYRTGSALARVLPVPVATGSSRALGAALSRVMRGRRTMIARHLQRAHGGALGAAELDRAVQRAFDSYARYWVESFRLPDLSPADLDAGMDAEGVHHVDAALEAGKGAVMALPHLGGWDFGGAWFATKGYPITVVVEPVRPPELFEWFADFRRTLGLTVVPLGPDVGGVLLRALGRNEVVGLVCDRDLAGNGVDVEFFGERTTLPAGPATLALRTGAPVLPTAVYFGGAKGHRGVVKPPLPLARQGRLRDDVARATQLIAHALEDLIREAPDQWHLMQPNWPSDRAVAGG